VVANYLDETDPDAQDAMEEDEESALGNNGHYLRSESALSESASHSPQAEQVPLKFGDLCPECGQAAVVNEEGCRKCYACGYSEC
jgi:ribonucleoside-diphosphate reductase alpha chain